ncbi:hypothetical protein PFLUV_G00267460 [Perca fluviatilis]|uniref:Fibronectin type-III domain-containing protein n=1 Tax=Perca fluviatilis TaxID=8168 RepID=A0A6A5DN10_PERFL|nr:hypothetical protein PFLUV_G00267460 [Perca fluviatilis]
MSITADTLLPCSSRLVTPCLFRTCHTGKVRSNVRDQITEEVLLWHKEDTFVFILSDLEPCTRVRFGLQTVCQAGIESRYSTMVLNDGNSVHSSIEALQQTSYGHDSYTLSWESRDTSSISMFRIYHEGELQGTTLVTNFTVGGLLPCQQHQAKVEALCGDGVLMNAKTVVAHTGNVETDEKTTQTGPTHMGLLVSTSSLTGKRTLMLQ